MFPGLKQNSASFHIFKMMKGIGRLCLEKKLTYSSPVLPWGTGLRYTPCWRRHFFPAYIQVRIDAAAELGRELTWEKRLLHKELNISLRITGNALALAAPGGGCFLSFSTPDRIMYGIEDGKFEKDEGLTGYSSRS